MTTINSLPPECLEHIFLYLKHNAAALATLLNVNRLFFQITVPILYADPFSSCSYGSRSKLHKVLLHSAAEVDEVNGCEGFSTVAFLSQTRGQCGSLTCVGKCHTGVALEATAAAAAAAAATATVPSSLATTTTSTSGSSNSSITTATIKTAAAPTTIPPTMARYMDSLTAFDGQIWMVYAARCMSHYGYRHLTAKFYLHIQMTILRRSAHRITYMVLLPGFICPILPLASRMRSLTRLLLAGAYNSAELSHLIHFLRLRQGHGENAGAGGPGLKECNLPKVIVSAPGSDTHPHHGHHHHHHHMHSQPSQAQLTQQARQQQLHLIHALRQPVSLDANSCQDFSLISHFITCNTLARLQKFKHVLGFLEGDGGKFLRRCRALQDLDFASFHRNVFSWAESEKSALIQEVAPQNIGVEDDRVTAPLVQLKTVRMAVSEWMVGRILKSLTFSFAHSLTELLFNVYDHMQLLHVLCSHTVSRIESEATPDEAFTIDHNFRLVRLRKLRMIRVTEAVRIGQLAFQGCEELQSLSMSGNVSCGRYGFDVFKIPKLRLLELGCGAAAHFRFESLEFSPLLESLALRENLPAEFADMEPTVIPIPVPWTWTLEFLHIIQLSGRPAFHFRFEWIRKCPSLKTLVIDGMASAALRPNPDDVSKGRCGTQLRTCELQIYSKQEFNKFQLAKLIETYCGHVVRLKLIGRLYASDDWRNVDLGLALYVSRKLTSMEMLVVQLGPSQTVETLTEKYGLVRGTVRTQPPSPAFWCSSLKLKKTWIEIMDAGADTCNFFRQKQSWFSPLEKLLTPETRSSHS